MSASKQVRSLPLEEVHRGAGCERWSTEGGYRVPEDYGDPGAERRALRRGTALYDASAWGRVEILGADSSRLLNGFCTVNVEELTAGGLAYALITAAKGQVLADMAVSVHEDRLWLRLPPGQGKPMREHLGKYVIAEDVELLPMGDLVPLWVLGPNAVESLRAAGVEVPSPGRHGRMCLGDTEVHLEHAALLGLPGICISVSASVAGVFAADLRRRLDVPWAGRLALESVRVGAGMPRWGVDFGPDTLPQEAGLNAAVDYEKGCYLGQEVIARLHYRGQAQRRLCAVEVEASGELPAAVISGGDEVGKLTSLDPLPTKDDARAGIAMLKRSLAEPGISLEARGCGALTVIRLPAVEKSGVAS